MRASSGELSRAVLAALLLAALAASVAGCARRARRTPDDTLVVLMDVEIGGVDPRFLQNASEKKISGLVAAGLVTVDERTLEPRLELAERVDAIDAVTWEATVRADARFPDGSPVTADDVVYTFQSILDPQVGSNSRRAYEERLAAVEKLDERRVRFRLKQPLATFMMDLDFGIVSAREARARGGRWPDGGCVGAGPYRVVSMRAEEVVLERNEHYVGGPPPTRRIVVKTVRDPNARLIMLVGGSADFTQNTVRPDLVDAAARRPRLAIAAGRSAILSYLMFHNEDPILRDPRVRRAIAHAIDREAIVRGRFGGRAVLATGLLPPAHWAYSGAVRRVEFDPALAARLLDEAGYPDPDGPGGAPRFRLTYKTSAEPFRMSVARTIAQQLGDVGIAVEVRAYDFPTFFADVKAGNYQLASMQTAEIVEPDMYWVYFHSSRIPTREHPDHGNRWRYRNAEVDRLIEAGRGELDRAARARIYAEVQRLLAEELPVFPLWHEDNVAVMNRDVRGYQVVPNARLTPLAKAWKARD